MPTSQTRFRTKVLSSHWNTNKRPEGNRRHEAGGRRQSILPPASCLMSPIFRGVRSLFLLSMLVIFALGQSEILTITSGTPIEREIAGSEAHSHRLSASAGEFIRVVIDQRGVDVALALFAPDEKPIAEAVILSGAFDVKRLSFIAEMSGEYKLTVRPLGASAARGAYAIRIAEQRRAIATDLNQVSAERKVAEAESLVKQSRGDSTRSAIAKYQDALTLWREIGDRQTEAFTLLRIGNCYHNVSELNKAIDTYNQSLAIWRELSEPQGPQGVAAAMSSLGWSYSTLGRYEEALNFYNQALPLRRQYGSKRAVAQTLSTIGLVYAGLREPQKALEHYLEALPLANADGDLLQEAFAMKNIGWLYAHNGDARKSLEYAEQSLLLYRKCGNRQGEADTLNLNGVAWAYLGEYGKALDYKRQSLNIWRETGNRFGEAQALHNIGVEYHFLNEFDLARDYYNQALAVWQSIGNAHEEAKTLNSLGLLSRQSGDVEKTSEYFERSLALTQRANNHQGQAGTLLNLGLYLMDLNKDRQAIAYFDQALKLAHGSGDRLVETILLYGLGRAHTKQGNAPEAKQYFSQALENSRIHGYPRIETGVLHETAIIARDSGDLNESQALFTEALKVNEAWLSRLSQQTSNTNIFQRIFSIYDDFVDTLIRLHRRHPEKGYARQAFEISERGRARRLLDLLGDARADARQNAPIELIDRERALRWQIGAKDTRRRQLTGSKLNEPQLAKVEQELRDLIAQYHETQARIRELSPGYAALTRPAPLGLTEIQKLLDDDTVLLEYLLSADGSKLWAVTRNSINYFDLPKQGEIETAARRVYELLKAARPSFQPDETPRRKAQRLARIEAEYHSAASALSQMLLSPVAAQLGKKRLVIVPDGALQYVPFGALPSPECGVRNAECGVKGFLNPQSAIRNPQSFTPLIVKHEVVSLPSATVLTALRQKQQGRSPAAKSIAVLADPVFSVQDARLIARGQSNGGHGNSLTALSSTTALTKFNSLERSAGETGMRDFQRLKYSREEAEAIAGLAPAEKRRLALDFAANLQTAISNDLNQFRIVHFATHGLVNTKNPELSGLVLSLFNEKGEPQEGFLRLYEIYNLRLNADLVVLSGCETALGKEIRGEGLVGLTCGFMYAGAPRVVASLWRVDDQATARLMKRFYQKMLGDGMRPAAALRAAQIAMWNEEPRAAPYAWAAFVLQGEWR